MMSKWTEARQGLIRYNIWRRGEEGVEMPHPKDVGVWIEAAIEALSIAEKLMQEPSEMMVDKGWRENTVRSVW